jgi:hypothetical protein
MTKSNQPHDQKIFRLTGIKRRTLALLAEYFCLRPIDIAPLLYGKVTPINRVSVNRTLRILRAEGYVNRLPHLDLDIDRGRATYVYGLTDKGAKLAFFDVFPSSHETKSFDEHSQRTLDHELEISYFHIALKQFCRKHGLELFWQQTDLKKKTIAPDAMFAITDPKKPEGENTHYYFLEIERSKIGNVKNGEPSIMRKLGKYRDYFNSDECEKEWEDFRQFRVIVVQRTEARRKNLLEALSKQYSHRMFWLTTEPAYKEDIGGNIFLTPKDYAHSTYSFNALS